MTAQGTTNLVAFDYQARKPRRLPLLFRDAVARFEGVGDDVEEMDTR